MYSTGHAIQRQRMLSEQMHSSRECHGSMWAVDVGRGVWGVGRGVWGRVCCLSWWGWGESTRSLPTRCPPPTALPASVQMKTPHVCTWRGEAGGDCIERVVARSRFERQEGGGAGGGVSPTPAVQVTCVRGVCKTCARGKNARSTTSPMRHTLTRTTCRSSHVGQTRPGASEHPLAAPEARTHCDPYS